MQIGDSEDVIAIVIGIGIEIAIAIDIAIADQKWLFSGMKDPGMDYHWFAYCIPEIIECGRDGWMDGIVLMIDFVWVFDFWLAVQCELFAVFSLYSILTILLGSDRTDRVRGIDTTITLNLTCVGWVSRLWSRIFLRRKNVIDLVFARTKVSIRFPTFPQFSPPPSDLMRAIQCLYQYRTYSSMWWYQHLLVTM